MFFKLAAKSLWDRKGSVLLSVLAMALSIFVLLAVEQIRHQAKENFTSTVSGVDLIVGARTSSINLLLYSVFRIGAPTNNIRWKSFQTIAENNKVAWAIPISLGDSHKGYRVMGTTQDYFKYFSYGQRQTLQFVEGDKFQTTFDVVIGAEVAKKLNYQLGDKLILAHGISASSFSRHDDWPFTVVGILAPTGTPVDQTLHVSLQGIEAIHLDWQPGTNVTKSKASKPVILDTKALEPKAITAFMLGLQSKMTTFQLQRAINQYRQEPLTAILPGVALVELWQMIGFLENTLLLVSVLLFFAASLGVTALLLSSMRERRHEIQLLRTIGAAPYFLFLLIEMEALLITALAVLLASLSLWVSFGVLSDYLLAQLGLYIEIELFTRNNLFILLALIGATLVAAMVPAISRYRQARSLKT